MRLKQAAAIPAVAAIALSGAVAFGGCGSDSNAATNESTTDSMHHETMKDDDGAMKHEDHAMKHEGDAMKHGDGSMKDHDNAMKHEGSSSDHMEG
jgi:hypothetical protein